MTDVGTTPRKALTGSQRLALFEREKGICCLCGGKIDGSKGFIDEHKRALGLGGSNDPSNRGVAHPACAAAKTNGPEGDLAKIAEAKRTKRAHLRIKSAPTQLTGPNRAELNDRKATRSRDRSGDRLPQHAQHNERRMPRGFVSAGDPR